VTAQETPLPNDLSSVSFDVTVPPGESRYLMFFHQMFFDNSSAAAGGPTYDANPASTSELLAGLDPSVLPLIVNWSFPAPAPTPSAPVPVAPVVAPRFTG